MASIYIETFGCQMNEADSQYIAERAFSAGYSVAEKAEQADVLLLNTCTVRESAERRAYGRIHQFKSLKHERPEARIVVCGCLAEQDRERMQGVAPHVDAVFGTSELARLGDALVEWRGDYPDGEEEAELLTGAFGGNQDRIGGAYAHVRGFVTVQRGCSYYCTFCIVPHVRGRFDHRPMAAILGDVRERIAAGAREVTLVGQTVNAYRDASGAGFGELLEEVGALPGLERFTFVTSHPKDLTETLIAKMAAIPKLNPRLHLPLQSGSNAVLRRMNRKYTVERYLAIVAAAREQLPSWALTTDLIVGFPGESEEDFRATLDICAQLGFAQAYMFVYSQRRGTPAARWEQIAPEISARRLQELIQLQNGACRTYHARKVGTVVRTLVQGTSRKNPNNLAAKTIDNVTAVAPLPNDYPGAEYPWLDVRIEVAFTWGVVGTATGCARSFDDPATPLAAPAFDLLAV